MTNTTENLAPARLALASDDPAAMGASGALAALTAADWRAMDEETRQRADAWIDVQLAGHFTARSTRRLCMAAAATRDAA
jgi:hypothetical protein